MSLVDVIIYALILVLGILGGLVLAAILIRIAERACRPFCREVQK